jgi:hypothetical protein
MVGGTAADLSVRVRNRCRSVGDVAVLRRRIPFRGAASL